MFKCLKNIAQTYFKNVWVSIINTYEASCIQFTSLSYKNSIFYKFLTTQYFESFLDFDKFIMMYLCV